MLWIGEKEEDVEVVRTPRLSNHPGIAPVSPSSAAKYGAGRQLLESHQRQVRGRLRVAI
jgi:hypothetical protein